MTIKDPYITSNAFLQANGGSIKSALVNSSVEFVKSDFKNNPEYEEIVYWGDPSGTKQGVIMTQSNTLKNVSDDRIAIAYPGETFTSGEIVTWKNTQWLIYEVNKFNLISDVANLKRCKYLLKFFDTSYRYAEVPCALSKTLLKEDNSRYQDIGTDEVWLYVPSNEYTDNMPKGGRLMIGRNVYTLESMDFIQYDGIILIRLSQNDINRNEDNTELGIAGYGSNIAHYSLSSSYPESYFMKIGSKSQLDVSILIDGLDSNYCPFYESTDENIVSISPNGVIVANSIGNASIQASFLGLKKTISISVVDELSSIYSIEFAPSSPNKMYTNCSYEVSVVVHYNGDIDDKKDVVWSIVDGETFAEIEPYGQNCIITTGEITNRYITIRASVKDDPSVFVDHNIKIVGLLG